MEDWISRWGLVAVLFGAAFEGDVTMIVAGATAHLGALRFPAVVAAGAAGSFLADVAIFGFSRRHAERARRLRIVVSMRARVEPWLDRVGSWQIATCRFVWGARIPTLVLWALRGLTWRSFLPLAIAGCLSWSLAAASLGWLFANAARALIGEAERLEMWITGILAAAVTISMLRSRWARRRARLDDSRRDPVLGFPGSLFMKDRTHLTVAIVGGALAVALALAGWFVGDGLYRARASERYVTVKGLAEREVPANLALWPIVFTVTADDLETLQRRVDDGTGAIRAYLSSRFEDDEIAAGAPRITDREAQGMMGTGRQGPRYVAEAVVTVRTGKISAVREAVARSGELVGRGVALIRSYEYNTQYLFTELEKIKPEMIAEATRDARRAAEQFASDSGSRVGAIRNAQQGLFSVEDRDPFSPDVKKVRVVTTIQFFLSS